MAVLNVDVQTKDAIGDWDDVKEKEVIRKLNRHILHKFCILTVLNYLDRTNLAFAAPRMNKDLQFTDQVYAIGAGVFFISYSLFQVPSNLVLLRLGGRRWLSFMLVAWGITACLFAVIQGPKEFYILRFVLGLAECGSFPGMWMHLSHFYDSAHMSVAYGTIVAAVVLSQVVGGPIAAALLSLDGVLGLRGWRWLFILEGLPTIVFGVYMWFTLVDSPEQANFLTADEKAFLIRRLQQDKGSNPHVISKSWDGAGNWRTWYCAFISLQNAIAKYAILYWTPLIVYKLLGNLVSEQKRDWVVALLTGIPFSMAAAATMLIARSSKFTGEVQRHVWMPMGAAGLALFGLSLVLTSQPVLAFFLLIPATLLWANEGVFMSWPRLFLQGAAAATGVALINSIGNCGGVIGPSLLGLGNYSQGMMILSVIVCFNTALAAAFPLPVKELPLMNVPLQKNIISLRPPDLKAKSLPRPESRGKLYNPALQGSAAM